MVCLVVLFVLLSCLFALLGCLFGLLCVARLLSIVVAWFSVACVAWLPVVFVA